MFQDFFILPFSLVWKSLALTHFLSSFLLFERNECLNFATRKCVYPLHETIVGFYILKNLNLSLIYKEHLKENAVKLRLITSHKRSFFNHLWLLRMDPCRWDGGPAWRLKCQVSVSCEEKIFTVSLKDIQKFFLALNLGVLKTNQGCYKSFC